MFFYWHRSGSTLILELRHGQVHAGEAEGTMDLESSCGTRPERDRGKKTFSGRLPRRVLRHCWAAALARIAPGPGFQGRWRVPAAVFLAAC